MSVRKPLVEHFDAKQLVLSGAVSNDEVDAKQVRYNGQRHKEEHRGL